MVEGSIDAAGAVAAEKPPTGVTLASDLTPEATRGRFEKVGNHVTPCGRVFGAGAKTPHGYAPENDEHLDRLTEIVNGRRIGRDPMALPVKVLTAAGHGPHETRRVVSTMGEVPLVDGLKRYKDLRRQCFACAENAHRGIDFYKLATTMWARDFINSICHKPTFGAF